MKLSRMAVAVALTAGFAASAQAVPFDPDGAGPAGAINLGAFDWGPTTIFAYGSTTAGGLVFARRVGGLWARQTVGPMGFDSRTALRFADDGTPYDVTVRTVHCTACHAFIRREEIPLPHPSKDKISA